MHLPMRCHVCQTRFPRPIWGVGVECPRCGEVLDIPPIASALPVRNAFEVQPKPPAAPVPEREEPKR